MMMLQTPEKTQLTSSETTEAVSPKKRPSLGPLLALRPYALRYKAMMLAAFVALVLSAAATLTVPFGVRHIIDHGFSSTNPEQMNRYFAFMLMVGAVLALASSARFFCVNWLGERVVADLRADLFRHLTRLSPSFYETTHSGEVMSRLTADTTQVKSAFGTTASQALRNLCMLVGALVMMFLTSLKLSLMVLVVIPLIVLPLVLYGRSVRRLSRKAQDTLAEASAFASENLSSIRILQAFTYEQTAFTRFRTAVDQSFFAARSRMAARAGLTALAICLVSSSVMIVLWIGAQEVISGAMSGGRLGQFILYAVFAAGALGELSEVWGEVQQAAGAAERLGELMTVEPEIKDPEDPSFLPSPVQGHLTFDKVSFSYPGQKDKTVLRKISFDVMPGEMVAIVGPSGAGKSTLFNLLLRFYDPTDGVLKLEGVAVNTLRLEDLRRSIALVPQETTLFAGTIADNISYGSPDATPDEIKKAAETAFAHDFILALPHGYDSLLGERGITLSGGQRQRIAIARAVLKNAPVLLLDEATSALDAESEKLVQTALEHIMQNRTTLVIAHRLATVQKADRILVMDEGQIVETGTHDTLVKQGGLYARLAELQFNSGMV